MKDFITLITEHLSPDQLHQLQRALETMRDCAKAAMAHARKASNTYATDVFRSAYQATSSQLGTLRKVLMTKEGD